MGLSILLQQSYSQLQSVVGEIDIIIVVVKKPEEKQQQQ